MKQFLNKKRQEFRIEIRDHTHKQIFRAKRRELAYVFQSNKQRQEIIQSIIYEITNLQTFQTIFVLNILKKLKCFSGETLDNHIILEFITYTIKNIIHFLGSQQTKQMLRLCSSILNQFLTACDSTIVKRLNILQQVLRFPQLIGLYYNLSLVEIWQSNKQKQQYMYEYLKIINNNDFNEQKQIFILQNFLIRTHQLPIELTEVAIQRLNKWICQHYYLELSQEALLSLLNCLQLLLFTQKQILLLIKQPNFIDSITQIFLKNQQIKLKKNIIKLFISIFASQSSTYQIIHNNQLLLQIIKKNLLSNQIQIVPLIMIVLNLISRTSKCIHMLINIQIPQNIIIFCARRNCDKKSKFIGYQFLLNLLWFGNDQQCLTLLIKNICYSLFDILKCKKMELIAYGLQCIQKLLDCHKRIYEPNGKGFNIKNQLQNRYRLSQILDQLSICQIKQISSLADRILDTLQ